VPEPISENAMDAVLKAGYKVVLIGRTYEVWNSWGGRRDKNEREEYVPQPRPGVLNLIDRLSVPGCWKLLQKAAGVFCCESAIMHLAWRMNVPAFVAVSERQVYWKPDSWVCWGKDLPRCAWTFFHDYKQADLEAWLSVIQSPVREGA